MANFSFFRHPFGHLIEDPACTKQYNKLMAAAASAYATPRQSGYVVLGAAMTKSGRIVRGGNHEYGPGRAIHCEEALVAHALQAVGRNDPIVALAFSGKNESERSVPTPCGNCRDVLREYLDPQAVIMAGPSTGGIVYVVPLDTYYHDSFLPLRKKTRYYDLSEERGIRRAKEALAAAHIAPMKKQNFGAALLDRNGRLHAGSHLYSDSYHPTLPLQAALSARQFAPYRRRASLERVIIVSHNARPNVSYLDRQLLFEAVYRDQREFGVPPVGLPVRLYRLNNAGEIVKGWETDSHAWLPFFFHPGPVNDKGRLTA